MIIQHIKIANPKAPKNFRNSSKVGLTSSLTFSFSSNFATSIVSSYLSSEFFLTLGKKP
jgi:hypothetical protein